MLCRFPIRLQGPLHIPAIPAAKRTGYEDSSLLRQPWGYEPPFDYNYTPGYHYGIERDRKVFYPSYPADQYAQVSCTDDPSPRLCHDQVLAFPQAYWRSEQQFPVEEKPLITPRQTETTSSAQSSYENTYTNSLRSYTSDAPGYPSTGELHNASIFIARFIVSLVSKINIRVCLTKKKQSKIYTGN